MIKHPLLLSTPLALVLAACGGSGNHSTPATTPTTVYTMTNSQSGNAVEAFRLTNGTLTQIGTYPTGGSGTGSAVSPLAPMGGNDPLGSAHSIIISPNKQFLFAVNAGGGTVSSFRIATDGTLTLASTVGSGGTSPNSVAATNSIIYVSYANAPGATTPVPGQLAGFSIGSDGTLTAIPGSTRNLGAANSLSTAILFSTDGTQLLSTERTLNALVSYPVTTGGTLGTPTLYPSGDVPFGIDMNGSTAIVADAMVSGAVTYQDNAGTYIVSSASNNGNKATCWVSFTPDGKHAFTANAGSSNITTYAVGAGGTLSIQQSGVATGGTDGPLDGGVTSDGKYYVQLLGATGKLEVFSIDNSGNLTAGAETGVVLPTPGGQGLAIR